MKAVFRVDASAQMGIGHLMRCLTLAEALRERGVQIQFICREHPGNLIALLQIKAMPVMVLPTPVLINVIGENYAAWLGVTQIEDVAETIEALNGERPDWLVVDHYGLDFEWEQQIRPHTNKLMVIDDLANRNHECDVLLDQNYSVGGEHRYAGLVPDTCNMLLGPRFALLRSEYLTYRKNRHPRDGRINRVLVFFGGVDPCNMTGYTLEALSQPEWSHLNVDVVIGANNPYREVLERQVRARPHTSIYGSRPHLADLMAHADLAFGAGGATTWERMCLGLPTIVISIAENQLPASESLAKGELIYYAGHFPDIRMNYLAHLLKQLSHDAEKLIELGIRNQLQVDGLGALRLAEVLCPSEINEIRLRPAGIEDIFCYYNWANDPEVRKNAVNTHAISWETHQAWFEKKLLDANSHLFVLEVAGLPVGQIRFDRKGGEAHIDYSLDSIVRGRGWSSRLIDLGTEMMRQKEPVRLRAHVKAGNAVSVAVFQRMGFIETKSVAEGMLRSFYCNLI